MTECHRQVVDVGQEKGATEDGAAGGKTDSEGPQIRRNGKKRKRTTTAKARRQNNRLPALCAASRAVLGDRSHG